MTTPSALQQGRELHRRHDWSASFEALRRADSEGGLDAADLELLATAAYLVGRDDDAVSAFERSYRAHVEAREVARAGRCAFWLGLTLLFRGEHGGGTGWLARARRTIADADCVEQGYLLLPEAEEKLVGGHADAALLAATRAVEIGTRFDDLDLVACARHLQGRARIQRWEVRAGLALLDEAMIAVTGGELSPIMTGLVYCSVIETCQQSFALGRAREWTSSMTRWCEGQPDMVAFTSTCLVRRAEILRLGGSWSEALKEATRATDRPKPPGEAFYEQGEVHRLRGEFEAAEEAYRRASRSGWEPRPGLALLRLAQGDIDAAAAWIDRLLRATSDRAQRAALLPAYVEVMIARGDHVAAREACRDLEEIAGTLETEAPAVMSAHARGALELAEGNPHAALASLRRAWEGWESLGVPYEAARARLRRGIACRALGDQEGAELEIGAAAATFERLGAAPDLESALALRRPAAARNPGNLTPRELQVLRLVATGRTNRAIAAELNLSRKTVDRHVSNIFVKLDVPTRAAATAVAYERNLI